MSLSPPWWRPDVYERRRPFLAARSRIIAAIRGYFRDQGFVEVETPSLQVSPGLEPHLKAFATTLEAPGGEESRLYLHTSPEFAMKKLLVAGEKRLFQLARAFRNGERSATHHPEFTMLEWYRAGADYRRLMEDCEALMRTALAAGGAKSYRWRGLACDPHLPWQHLTVADAFQRHAGIDLFATIPMPGRPDAADLARQAQRLGLRTASDDRWDDIFFRIFLERIEPHLGTPAPTILMDYPVHLAALSRPKPEDGRVAERFELYIAGLELANAFGELCDPVEQQRRFAADMALKRRIYGLDYPIDADFIAALEHGMPESAGIALGVDRLVMLATGAERIEDVLWLPVADKGS
ncbi:MAG: EF-P lysine aminoacylase GenX [Proteobacteria bacterium]|nr:EF-P lysine aminoacylase GenX [Pseudomonadota bacterium]